MTVPAAPPSADLSLDDERVGGPGGAGNAVQLDVLMAHNNGPRRRDWRLRDRHAARGRHAHVGDVDVGQGSCTVQNSTVTCAIGSLAVNASATITLNVTGTVGGVLHNTAFVTASEADPVPENNTAMSEDTTIDARLMRGAELLGPGGTRGSVIRRLVRRTGGLERRRQRTTS